MMTHHEKKAKWYFVLEISNPFKCDGKDWHAITNIPSAAVHSPFVKVQNSIPTKLIMAARNGHLENLPSWPNAGGIFVGKVTETIPLQKPVFPDVKLPCIPKHFAHKPLWTNCVTDFISY